MAAATPDYLRVDRKIDSLVVDLRYIVRLINGMLRYHRIPVYVYETGRSRIRQRWLFAQGYSKTRKGNHPRGRAFDLVPRFGRVWSWKAENRFWVRVAAELIKSKMESLDWPLKWGGNWKGDYDPAPGVQADIYHWELKKNT